MTNPYPNPSIIGNANTMANGTEHQIPSSNIVSDMHSNVPKHPEYSKNLKNWNKYRLTAEGGDAFVNKYLKQFSKRESEKTFADRKEVSYCAAHAKAALIEIKNALYKNFGEILRQGGPASYQKDVVTESGESMNTFIGCEILYELLSIGKVGVFIDREPIEDDETKLSADTKPLYLYAYNAESIVNWSYDKKKDLKTVLLRDCTYDETDDGLTKEEKFEYRLLKKVDGGVEVQFYNEKYEKKGEPKLLKISKIPLVIFDLGYSLLADVAGYQIALTNLASSDMSYALSANHPFYTEFYDPMAESINNKAAQSSGKAGQTEGRDVTDANKQIDIGPSRGRRIAKGLERPQFIHPSAEPLKASMEKQAGMQSDIRVLLDLALTNLAANRTSAESKREDKTTKEEGLSYIGLILEAGERRLSIIWSEYENSEEVATVQYPTDYSLSSNWDRLEEAAETVKQIPLLPSITYQRSLAKRVARLLVGHRVPKADLQKIYEEIDAADVIGTTPNEILADVKEGLVSHEYASSKLRNYPVDEAGKAKKEHTERLAEIAKSQSQEAKPPKDPAAAGVPDLSKDKN